MLVSSSRSSVLNIAIIVVVLLLLHLAIDLLGFNLLGFDLTLASTVFDHPRPRPFLPPMPEAKSAPAQPPAKGSVAAPKLNSEMELGSLNGGGSAAGSVDGAAADEQQDIMHLARVGDVAAMEKLFAGGEYDATYMDSEGITPLHVSSPRRGPGPRALRPVLLAVPAPPC